MEDEHQDMDQAENDKGLHQHSLHHDYEDTNGPVEQDEFEDLEVNMPAPTTVHRCKSCSTTFASRNKLSNHLRNIRWSSNVSLI